MGTDEAILQAASACFARDGYRKTSVAQIAKAARVGKGTVYLYCDSKEDLLYRAAHRELLAWVDDLARLIDPRRRADEILLDMARDHMAFLDRRPLARDLLLGVLDGQLPDWRPQFRELRELGLRHVVEVLELGIRQGVFHADLDVTATARVLQDMEMSGVLLGRRSPVDPETIRRQRAAAVRLIQHGLLRTDRTDSADRADRID